MVFIISFLVASFVIQIILWAFRVVPFVKRFTGGGSGRILFNNTVIYSDFFLAVKIVKKEKIQNPLFLKVFAVIGVFQFVMLAILIAIFFWGL